MPRWSVSSTSVSMSLILYPPSPFKRLYEPQIKANHNDVLSFCWDRMAIETPPSLYSQAHVSAFKQVSWLISDTHLDCKRKGEKGNLSTWHLVSFYWTFELNTLFLLLLWPAHFELRKQETSSVSLLFLSSTFNLQWSDESPLASVKLSGWFYSWLSITYLVKNKNMCSLLIDNQWSIKQAICLIRAKGPSGLWLI